MNKKTKMQIKRIQIPGVNSKVDPPENSKKVKRLLLKGALGFLLFAAIGAALTIYILFFMPENPISIVEVQI